MVERIARVTRWLLPATLALCLAALGWWWWTDHSEVTVDVDGEQISVRTRADTVAGVLREEDVVIDAHDRVTPPLEDDVDDGVDITVERAQPLTLELNGALRTVWTTGDTVEDVLDELGLVADEITPAPATPLTDAGMVVLKNSVDVEISVAGDDRQVMTTSGTVRELLDELEVEVDADDVVEPPPGTELTDGLDITVSRIDSEAAVEDIAIPFDTERRDDPSLERGQIRTIQEGQSGLERIEYELVRRDGEVVERSVESRELVREPVTRILAVGTKVTARASGQASWYSAGSMTCAHRTLSFGTRVTVVNVATGASVVCTVNDRGPFVEGRVVDLAHDAFSQIADPAAGVIDVSLSW